MRRWPAILPAGFSCILLFSSCARTTVQPLRSEAGRLPKPDAVAVHDFSVSPDQVALDHTIGLRLRGLMGGDADANERLRVAQEISKIVTENLVKDLRKQGINAVTASSSIPAGRTLSIQGQFFSIDQGSQRRRLIVGFGVGASTVRTLVQVFEETGTGPRMMEDFYVTVQSSRKPGMGPMAGAGAAGVSAASSAVVGSATGLVGASSQTVEADARHLADQISEELKKFFLKQGWVTAGS